MQPLIIAGNGPSLAAIDYALLPADFDVFRANQFYAEPEYFLGKKVTGAFFNLQFVKPQTYTFYQLKHRGEYEIEQLYCTYPFPLRNSHNPDALLLYPEVRLFHDYLMQFPELYLLNCYHERYSYRHFTSGICMLITGIALGYREIFLTGIDFYEGAEKYAFKHAENMRKLLPQIDDHEDKDVVHTKDIDLQGLELCKSILQAKGGAIYSLSPESVLSQVLPLPPRPEEPQPTASTLAKLKASKAPDAILDICQPQAPELANSATNSGQSQTPIAQNPQPSPSLPQQMLNCVLRSYRKLRQYFR